MHDEEGASETPKAWEQELCGQAIPDSLSSSSLWVRSVLQVSSLSRVRPDSSLLMFCPAQHREVFGEITRTGLGLLEQPEPLSVLFAKL